MRFAAAPHWQALENRRSHYNAVGMPTILHRLLVLCIALAFFVGVTGQPMPFGIAAPQTTVGADMAGGCNGPLPPCTGQMPNCLDHGGCIGVSVLPALPMAIVVPIEWMSLDYALAPASLAGISVKPELAPPIPAA